MNQLLITKKTRTVLFLRHDSPPCKVIHIPESGNFCLVESGIQNPLTIEIQNPSYTCKESGINPQGGIQHPRLCWITLHGTT